MTSKKKTSSKKKPTRSKNPGKEEPKKLSALDKRRTNNKSRVNRIKEQTKDEIRKKFKAAEYIRQLQGSAERLETIVEKLDVANTLKAKLTRREQDKLLTIKIQIDVLMVQRDTIKVQIDLNLRRLKYCIPELKSIELSDPDGKSPLAALAVALTEAAKS